MPAPTHAQKRELFERHFLFARLEPREIDVLAARARVERYPAGREIFAKGSPGRTLMAVLKGSVKISTLSPAGKEIALNVIHDGEIFGEIAVIDGEERTASAAAMSQCELLVLDRRDVIALLERHPEISMMLLRVLCQRLRRTSEQVEDVLFRSLQSRLAKALLELNEGAGPPGTAGAAAGLRLSQRELGNLVGGSRESINRQLQAWHKAGLIALARGSIAIRDAAAIKRLL
jgi:CRP/FNR family transcriptional regulator, cyclic AMP receptor protein